jgi:tetratricopeptide (TPR) repeat protein
MLSFRAFTRVEDADLRKRIVDLGTRSYEKLLALDVTGVDLVRARMNYANLNYVSGNRETAISTWRAVIRELKLLPQDDWVVARIGDALNNVAVAEIALGAYDGALSDLNAAEGYGKGDLHGTRLNKIIALVRKGDYEGAHALADTLRGRVRRREEHALLGLAFHDDRRNVEYALALDILTFPPTDESYSRLAKSCNELFPGLQFTAADFRK